MSNDFAKGTFKASTPSYGSSDGWMSMGSGPRLGKARAVVAVFALAAIALASHARLGRPFLQYHPDTSANLIADRGFVSSAIAWTLGQSLTRGNIDACATEFKAGHTYKDSYGQTVAEAGGLTCQHVAYDASLPNPAFSDAGKPNEGWMFEDKDRQLNVWKVPEMTNNGAELVLVDKLIAVGPDGKINWWAPRTTRRSLIEAAPFSSLEQDSYGKPVDGDARLSPSETRAATFANQLRGHLGLTQGN